MPIYEFYCPSCHTIYSFLSRAPNTRKRPACPACGRRQLERRASAFAISKGRSEPAAGADDLPDVDEARMERVMEEMARETESMDENDPRQVARLMRKLYDSTGLPLGEGMEEAMRRLEAGEDPDKIEDEMGDLLESEDALSGGEEEAGGGSVLRTIRRRIRPPRVDETLYEM
jgi:putative FmdB family regulatory protein